MGCDGRRECGISGDGCLADRCNVGMVDAAHRTCVDDCVPAVALGSWDDVIKTFPWALRMVLMARHGQHGWPLCSRCRVLPRYRGNTCQGHRVFGRWRRHRRPDRSPLEAEDIMQLHNALVAVGRTTLPALADPRKREVVQLSSQRGKGGVVEVSWQHFRFDTRPIMYDDPAKDRLSIPVVCSGTRDGVDREREREREHNKIVYE